MHSLRFRLFLAFLIFSLASITIVGIAANRITSTHFGQYVMRGSMMGARNLDIVLSSFYERDESWAGVQNLVLQLGPSYGARIIVADSKGEVVADSRSELIGSQIEKKVLSAGLPITISQGKTVGTLLVSGETNGGMGGMHMRGMGMRFFWEQEFLRSVNRSLILSGLVAVALAVIVSFLLARRITSPLQNIARGAREMAAGRFNHRVKVITKDEIGELAKVFNHMADSLEKEERLRRNMIADVAHELRTPLTTIQGYLEAIRDGVMSPTDDALASIHEETVFLARLVEDLRDLSLAEAGQLALHKENLDIADVIRKQVTAAEPRAQKKGIKLKVVLPESLSSISGDRHRMGQVLRNLISNSLRFTPENGSITVAAQEEENRLEVSVSDTGIGIEKEDLPFVFERFYRVDKSRARSGGGAGLGLTIAKYLVEAHGGSIKAESEYSKGAKFTLTIPLEREKKLE